MFVVTLPSSATDPQSFAHKAKDAGADILEIRGDLTPDIQSFESPLPLLISPRGEGDDFIKRFEANFTDLEIHETCNLQPATCNLIRSYHNYKETPSLKELSNIAKELMKDDPHIIKIATTINSYADLAVLEKLRGSLPTDQKRIILGMGPKAHWNRMLSPLRNEITYTYLDDGEQAAEGQVPLSMYQRTKHCTSPKIFGLIGDMQCSKSLSPLIHNTLFSEMNIDALYVLYPTEDLSDLMENREALGMSGLSITAPYKRDIMQYAEELDPLVEKLQSMNTATCLEGSWKGYNTDVTGIIEGYPFLNEAQSVLIYGSGGVVPSVIEACKQCGSEEITIAARNEEARTELAEKFGVTAIPLNEVEEKTSDILINTISVDTDINIPQPKTKNQKPINHAVDLRYNRSIPFLEQAEKKGYEVHDGLPMLLHQALKQFELFTGEEPNEEAVNHISYTLTSDVRGSLRQGSG